MPDSVRPAFSAYALPLARRREGRAAALSVGAHVVIALLVLWRGAEFFAAGGGGTGPRGGGGGGGPAAVSWLALPPVAASQADAVPPAPAVTVPALAVVPAPRQLKIDVPLTNLVLAPQRATTTGTGVGTTGGAGQGPGSGGGAGSGHGTGVGADSGAGSGGSSSDIFPASPRWAITPPQGMPKGRHEVRFWVTADGRVTRVEVTPPIKDAGYRREFTDRMMGYLFNPARTRDGRYVDYVATVTFTSY